MKIKNINGTSGNNCSCGSWLKHWRKFSYYDKTYCSEVSCTNQDLVGAHVQKNTSDMSWYIVPLCQTHNKSKEILDVGETTLISANINLTCKK